MSVTRPGNNRALCHRPDCSMMAGTAPRSGRRGLWLLACAKWGGSGGAPRAEGGVWVSSERRCFRLAVAARVRKLRQFLGRGGVEWMALEDQQSLGIRKRRTPSVVGLSSNRDCIRVWVSAGGKSRDLASMGAGVDHIQTPAYTDGTLFPASRWAPPRASRTHSHTLSKTQTSHRSSNKGMKWEKKPKTTQINYVALNKLLWKREDLDVANWQI